MATRKFTLLDGVVEPCPKCGNTTTFVARAEQVAEDCCDVWVTCVCGYDPTDGTGDRLEDVWGSLDKGTIFAALECGWTLTGNYS